MTVTAAAVRSPRGCSLCHGRSYVLVREGDRAVARICACSQRCTACGGSGFIYTTQQEEFSRKVGKRAYDVLAPCSCRLLKRRLGGFAAAGIPGVLAQASFENFRVPPAPREMREAKEVARAFAFEYARGKPSQGFILSGPVGTGKSHLLIAALSHLAMETGIPVKYVEISLLYATIRRGFQEGKSGGEIIGPLSEIDVLAIDELGKGRGSPFEMETLDELIARRYNAGRTTIFASNYSLDPERRSGSANGQGMISTEDLRSQASDSKLLRDRVGERIYSRLCEMCRFVQLPNGTDDYRRMRQELHGR